MIRKPPSHIVILGGGTAGWMAANLVAHKWHALGTKVTLVESPDVGIIGVGEGSTPQLKAFFDTLGISEAEWMPRCNATYKNGIRFSGWSDRLGFESYFHPFPTAVDNQTAPAFFYNTMARRTGRDVWAHPDRFFLPAHLAANKLAPLAAENFPFASGYGYHFDAYLVGAFLSEHAKKIGVAHLVHHVTTVVRSASGDISHLVTREGEEISGDFFIDSSGFRSTLLQEALAEPFVSFAENLFNDSAVVMPTPANPASTSAQTSATAMRGGWVWDIPLTNRTGNGYVYASDFISADAAETELRTHLGMLESDVDARHLKMKVGRVARSWVSNCLAIGLAQGFIEPLEATALHIVQTTVELFLESHENGITAEVFNAEIAARYDGIRDYIVCHYRVNQRHDTAYWTSNAENQNISDSLKAILTTWFTGKDLVEEIHAQGIESYYAPLSWHCLLAGYGTFPTDAQIKAPGADIKHYDMIAVDDFIRRCGLNFRDHKLTLDSRVSSSPLFGKVA
jgi:tryptophan 6-halogenase